MTGGGLGDLMSEMFKPADKDLTVGRNVINDQDFQLGCGPSVRIGRYGN